jgi:hypothetical protein
MASHSIYTGVALIVLGIAGYFGSGAASVTALIPAFIGAVFLVLGLLARNEKLRKHSMHASMLVALLAIAGTFRGVIGVFAWLGGTPPERPLAVVAQMVTAVLCLLLLIGGIRSFIAARRAA